MTDAKPQLIHGMSRREAERALVGIIFRDGDRPMGWAVEREVAADWFADRACRQGWLAVSDLFASGKPIDILTASTRLWDMHGDATDPTAATAKDVQDWIDHAPVEAHFEFVLDVLESHVYCALELAILANQQQAATSGDPQKVRDRVAAHAQAWADLAAGSKPADSLAQVALDWMIRVQTPKEKRPALVEWWLPQLTEKLGGLSDELVYLCALESVGKTAAALQMAVVNARRGNRVAIRSLESATARLVPRLIAHGGQVDRLHLERGVYSQDELRKARDAAAEIARLPIDIDDGPANVPQLRAWAMRAKARGAALLIIDNLRHVRRQASRKEQSTAEQFSELSHAIKGIRDDVRLPLIMLHHLTPNDKGGGDVSWSKDIRKDADILIFLTENEKESTAPSEDNDWAGRWIIDVEVKKHRDGEKGYDLRTWFDRARQTYRPYEAFHAADMGEPFAGPD